MSRFNVVVNGKDEQRFPHGLHLVLTFFTCGMWGFMWAGIYLHHKLCGGRG